MKRIVFTVTNDLNYDQRMQRICTSLANAGYTVLLVGRSAHDSVPLKKESYNQKRLACFFSKGFLFYAEYNLRLLLYLLFVKMDAVCAIDLDTILPCYFVSVCRQKKRIYDAHELFTEMKEVITRHFVKKVWLTIEKFAVPEFKLGYTVSDSIADEFKRRYNSSYKVIRNLPLKKKMEPALTKEKIILYQGAVNEARGLENLIDAMRVVDATLYIYGDGNVYDKIETLIQQNNLTHKIKLKGKVLPNQLYAITQQAYIGINLVEPIGLNQLYSLSNKFFDYIQAGIPQLTMNFPEYEKISNKYEVAVLIDTIDAKDIAAALNILLNDVVLYKRLKNNCGLTAKELTWQQEEKKLLDFYTIMFKQ